MNCTGYPDYFDEITECPYNYECEGCWFTCNIYPDGDDE